MKRSASDAEAIANRTESKTKKLVGQLGRTGFTTVGNQLIAFAVNEAVGAALEDSTGSKLAGFLGGVGSATVAGFAFGGVVGGAGALLTGTIAQIFSLISANSAKTKALEQMLEQEREAFKKIVEKTVENAKKREDALRGRIESIREDARKAAFDIAQNTYQYVAA